MKKSLVPMLMLSAVVLAAPAAFAAESAESSNEIPLTTTSDVARRAFRNGLENLERQQTKRAHTDFRAALRADENFALAHLFIAYDNGNPKEEVAELEKARNLSANISKPEQLMIEWLAGSRDGQYVPAITAMNDLIAQYPQDKFLLFVAGRWMVQHRNLEAAQSLLERAIAVDANYPAALNELAYAEAMQGSFFLAFNTLDKYVAAEPGEPNTEDSYGEISRMAGEYERALQHYQKALQYDPSFIWSQVGIADTYMLMGKEAQARAEYEKAMASAPTPGDRLTWKISSAMTYAYGNDEKSFFRAMQEVADEAHAMHFGVDEVIAYRYMAMYSHDPKQVMDYGKRAQEVLTQKSDISTTDADHEQAQILRTMAIHAAVNGDLEDAHRALAQLQEIAANSKSQFVQQTSEGTTGGVLWAEKKYAEAVPHLEEDERNPVSAVRLVQAYRATGDNEKADVLAKMVSSFHEPTIEELLAQKMLNVQISKK